MAEEKITQYVVRGEVEVSGVELRPDLPLRIGAVRDGKILTSELLEVGKVKAGKIAYELRFQLPLPCGFHLVLGYADVPHRAFLAAPLIQQWVPPQVMRKG